MKALIIYDSVYGNTEKVAQAISNELGSPGEVTVLRVGDVKPEHLVNLDLLIVGSPTQAFNTTAAIKKLVASIPRQGLKGVRVAAFDTRISIDDFNSRILPPMVKIFGYAAKPIADRLEKKGGELVIPPEGFFVAGTEGPLKEGELERAATWAQQIMVAG